MSQKADGIQDFLLLLSQEMSFSNTVQLVCGNTLSYLPHRWMVQSNTTLPIAPVYLFKGYLQNFQNCVFFNYDNSSLLAKAQNNSQLFPIVKGHGESERTQRTRAKFHLVCWSKLGGIQINKFHLKRMVLQKMSYLEQFIKIMTL